MKIGILGSGNIGKTLARNLSAAGHDVKVANSKGPETIAPEALEFGARAETASRAVEDVDVVILAIPFGRILDVKGLLVSAPTSTLIIDASNYYPFRDGQVAALLDGQVETLWVTEQLGRPVVKAWNAIYAATFKDLGLPSGTPGRLAIPFAAYDDDSRRIAKALVSDTGFDPYDAGGIEDSWRFQPGQPAYCTGLAADAMRAALDAADDDLQKRRDLFQAMSDYSRGLTTTS